MALTLSVANNQNGTATATVGGSAGGSVAVYQQIVSGQTGLGTWTLAGTRTGNGAVTFSLANGYYWGYAIEAADLSGLAYFEVTDGVAAVETRVRAAVKATIELLNLPIAGIYPQFQETAVNIKYPCVVLDTGEGVRETDEAEMNNRDDIGHPVRCLILANKDVLDNSPEKMALYESWRQKIYRAFVNQRLAGVPESVINKIEPMALAEQERSKYQTFRSGLLIRCRTREVRGLGA